MMEKRYLKFWRSYSRQTKKDYRELYKNTGLLISKHIQGEVLDVGSADVVNYDLSRVTSLTTADLYPTKYQNPKTNHKHIVADVRNIPLEEESFNCVVAQLLFHHLAEDSIHKTDSSLDRALSEIERVLKSDGQVLVIESFLPSFFEFLEVLFYPVFVLFCKLIDFPLVRQYSVDSFLKKSKKAGFNTVMVKKVEKGPFVSQFGLTIPSWLTPVEVYFIRLKKQR